MIRVKETEIEILSEEELSSKEIHAKIFAMQVSGLTVDEHTLRRAYQDAFQQMNELKVKNIALCGLDQKLGDFPVLAAAKILAQEILRFTRFEKHAVQKIFLTVHNAEALAIFKKSIEGYIHHVVNDLGVGPYVTVDILIELTQGLVLIERTNPPYGLALPGGFVDCWESVEDAARREAKEETGLDLEDLRQFHTYSDPRRDPRFHTVSTAFIARGVGQPAAGDDAKDVCVVPYEWLLEKKYAFDHGQIIRDYLSYKKYGKDSSFS